MPAVVETFGLTKIYKLDFLQAEYGRLKVRLSPGKRRRVALKDLTLAVEQGEIFGLLGPNGAGKTTTLKILMGIIFATRGTARLLGRPLGDKWAKARIGFLPENPYFYDYLTGREFLKYYAQLYGIARPERLKRADALLERVGLREAANLPLRGYSKGMLQRIGIAQALVHEPSVVFLDEPTTALDPLGRREVRDVIRRLKEDGVTVFLNSHLLTEVERVCDRVAIIDRGQVVQEGVVKELLARELQVEAQVGDVTPVLLEQLSRLGSVVSMTDSTVVMQLEEESIIPQIAEVICLNGGRLYQLTTKHITLEELFVSAVQQAHLE